MKRLLLVLGVLLGLVIEVRAKAPTESDILQESAGVIVRFQPVKGFAFGELVAVGEIDAPPEKVFSLLWDIPSHKDFMSPIKDATNVSTSTTKRVDHIVFYAFLPGLKDRDVVSETTLAEKSTQKISLQFQQKEGVGPKPSEDYVRLTLREGGWELVPIDGGKRTKATYRLRTDPGVEMAAKIVQNFAAKGIVEVYEAIRGRLKKGS